MNVSEEIEFKINFIYLLISNSGSHSFWVEFEQPCKYKEQDDETTLDENNHQPECVHYSQSELKEN